MFLISQACKYVDLDVDIIYVNVMMIDSTDVASMHVRKIINILLLVVTANYVIEC